MAKRKVAQTPTEEGLEARLNQLIDDFGLDAIQSRLSAKSKRKRGRKPVRDYTDVSVYLFVSINRKPGESINSCCDRISKMGKRNKKNLGAKLVLGDGFGGVTLEKVYDSGDTIRSLYYRAKKRLQLQDFTRPKEGFLHVWNPGDDDPEDTDDLQKAFAELVRAGNTIRDPN